MTARRQNPLPRSEIARLGGLAHSAEHMARIGARGQEASVARYGKRQLHVARLVRRGFNVAPVTQKTRRGNDGLSNQNEGLNR